MTPSQRSQRARLAAHAMHARHDARETTQAARNAFFARFVREADPDGVLFEAERTACENLGVVSLRRVRL